MYKVLFTKPIEKVLVYDFDFCKINTKRISDLEMLFYLCIEAFQKSVKGALEDLHEQKQVFNRYMIGRIMLTDTVLDSTRRAIRRLYPDVKVYKDELYALLSNEIFKRDIVEGDFAIEAKKKVQKAEKALLISKVKKEDKNTNIE